MSADKRAGESTSGDSEAIRANIDATRQRMGDTLEELASRLNPGHLKQQAKDKLREATIGRVQTMGRTTVDKASSAGRGVADLVKANPIPSALIALGAGWLVWSARRGTSSSIDASAEIQSSPYSERDNGMRSSPYSEPEFDESRPYAYERSLENSEEAGITDIAKEKASTVAGAARETTDRVAEKATTVANTVAEKTQTQSAKAASLFQDRPLVVGAIAAAVGLAVGSAIPPTQKEAELVGEKRDELMDKARNLVSEKKEQVKRVGQRVATQAKEAATQAAREEGLTNPS